MFDAITDTRNLLDDVHNCFMNTSWGGSYVLAVESLQHELNSPCVLAVAGKVKVGKSFLVNALLGVDLAMTGNTETTATINVFKSGRPISPDTPVLCEWTDGTKEWKSREFLNSLQGTSEGVLNITSRIDKLIFYIEGNPLLDEVTLVDTPGIGAFVGEGGDEHQKQTEGYFKLRKRHENETRNLTNGADAVIYLFNTVPTETDQKFLESLYNDGKGLSALNGIGVLSKIDRDLKQIDNIGKFSSEFEKQLFSIIPISAAVSRYMPDKKIAIELKKELRDGFASQEDFELAIKSEELFLDDDPDCHISVERKKEILSSFAKTDLPWSTFSLIAKELYYNVEVETALQRLSFISGIEPLKGLINNHFFLRSKQLRCNRVLSDLLNMLDNILYSRYFQIGESESRLKDQCLHECEKLADPYKTIVKELISKHVDNYNCVEAAKESVCALKIRVERLKKNMSDIDKRYLAYKMLIANKDKFTEDEFVELSILFTGQEIKESGILRQKYWAGRANASSSNSVEQQIAEIAKRTYYKLNTQTK